MKRRYVFAGFALVATLAVVSPALGGPSLKSLVKSEVAKQLSTAQTAKKGKRGPPGPAGPPGANGTNGTNGAPATKLFAAIDQDCASVARSSGGVTVAISGANDSRLLSATTSTFTLPLRPCGTARPGSDMSVSIWPAIRSCIAGAVPR